jgi:hypothetical protein
VHMSASVLRFWASKILRGMCDQVTCVGHGHKVYTVSVLSEDPIDVYFIGERGIAM